MQTVSEIRKEGQAAFQTAALAGRHLGETAIRILHVVPRLGLGGTERTLLRVIRELGDREFQHSICAVRGVDEAFLREAGLRLPIFSAGTPDPGFQFPLFRLARIMRQVRPNIVHSRNFGALDAVLAARLARVPFAIHSEHGYELEILRGLPLRRRLMYRAIYPAANYLFTVTEDLRDFHARQSWVSSTKFHIVRNGINIETFSNHRELGRGFRERFNIPEDRLVVGSVGRIVPIKGYGTLLEGAELALAKGPNLHVLLVGSGPELTNLKAYVRSSRVLNGRATFVDATPHVAEALNAMDIFVLPSFSEGMSNTVLEAMATERPVLLTSTGGNVELVQEGVQGFFFSPGDAAGLAELIVRLASDLSRREVMGLAGRQQVEVRFSLSQMIATYRDLYLKAALQESGN
ncbi:MAG TPA: glycosyltransferase [Dongiaceae bacterium]|nr:glycosyltransferase [Dongiaceae bacterium]